MHGRLSLDFRSFSSSHFIVIDYVVCWRQARCLLSNRWIWSCTLLSAWQIYSSYWPLNCFNCAGPMSKLHRLIMSCWPVYSFRWSQLSDDVPISHEDRIVQTWLASCVCIIVQSQSCSTLNPLKEIGKCHEIRERKAMFLPMKSIIAYLS